jgi:DNA-binding MarR family transcriptional regulator
MAERVVTPVQCAGVFMDVIPPLMRVIRREMRLYGALGLSMPQFRTLAYLQRHPGASLTDVAEHLGITPSTTSSLADRLVRQGLVERAGHPQERRRITLTLTPTGAQLWQDARAATQATIAKTLADLTPQQLSGVVDCLTTLGATFGRGPDDLNQAGSSAATSA